MNANPCEVCRFQNKQCVNNCMFALLFPSSDLEKFDVVNRIFGLETLTFYLKDLSPMERIDTTRTLYYEAKPCFLNPPKNPSKFLEALLNYPYQKAEEVSKTKKLLASYSRPCVVLALPAPKYTQSKSKPSVLRKRKRKTKSSDESALRSQNPNFESLFFRMAFCNKLGGLLRQNISSNGNVPVTSMLGSLRLMSTKLFIGGLSWGTDDASLRDAFAHFGDVVDAKVIVDRETGRSRGFGFVNFNDEGAATAAISEMDGKELNGRHIRVNPANDRPSAPRAYGGGGGYSGGGGGYGGGGGGYGGGGGGYGGGGDGGGGF